MAKWEGTQSIPSEWLDLWRATVTDKSPLNITRKRYPFRRRLWQKGKYKVTAKQKAQREKFELAIQKFKGVDYPTRQRWYDSMPPWCSYLWFYDYLIMSALMYDANTTQGGVGVIKSIQQGKVTVPTTGGYNVALNTIDPNKTVVMLYGSGRKVPRVIRGSGSVAIGGSTLALGATVDPGKCTVKLSGASYNHQEADVTAWAWVVAPYVFSLAATQITIKWALTAEIAATVGWEVTEHLEGGVYPVFTSIAANQLVIDWSEDPDAPADVSYIVIEYI